MDTIRFLLGHIVKLAFGLFLFAIVIWLIGFLYPQFSFSKLVSLDVFKRNWLPAPRNYAGLFAVKENATYGTVYVSNTKYKNGGSYYQSQPGVDFIAYTDSGTKIIKSSGNPGSPTVSSPNPGAGSEGTYGDRILYVRNLSVYEGGSITHGQTFVGEARDTMFRNGIFPIHIIDGAGRLIASTQAINTGAWAVAGWSRFQAAIPVRLPANTPCSLVFQSATQSLQISLKVVCK